MLQESQLYGHKLYTGVSDFLKSDNERDVFFRTYNFFSSGCTIMKGSCDISCPIPVKISHLVLTNFFTLKSYVTLHKSQTG